ncbi:MAG: 50S ribosomal protein L33 [Malacoplasma sp.]|nr:50S ribosomal protein L33 [Malacoplasma sp.]
MSKQIILLCDECLSRNYRTKSGTNRIERLQLNKYCPRCNKKTLHKETR